MIRTNSLRITAFSSSGLASTFMRHAASISVTSSKPESLTPSRKARGLNSSRMEPSLNFSGVEYFRKIYFTVFYCICNRSAIRMKHYSAISNMRSSSLNFSSSEPGPPDIKRRFSSPSEVAKDYSLSPDLRLEWRSPSWLRVLPELWTSGFLAIKWSQNA